MLVESRGLYKRTNTEVATSGWDSVIRMYVKPAVGIGGQTGVNSPLLSLETSSATAEGHAIEQRKTYVKYKRVQYLLLDKTSL